jgi:4-hydroxyacetophenone monooxygenase
MTEPRQDERPLSETLRDPADLAQWAARRDAALAQASVPTLLMCLAQITGDRGWLEDPFRPKRDVSIFADPSGGLPPSVQHTVRAAMAQVLQELASGRRTLPETLPDEETFTEMMSVCLGEPVPREYVPLAKEEMGFASRALDGVAPQAEPAQPGHAQGKERGRLRTLVVGAGITGICAAYRLAQLGLPFEIIEKNTAVGGTWWDNDYPEAGVDTPNHFYSYSFAPNLHWSSNYSKRAENLAYIGKVARDTGVIDRVRLRTEAVSMTWHEARGAWEVELRVGGSGRPPGVEGSNDEGLNDEGSSPVETRREWFEAVMIAGGPLSRPKLHSIPGIESFPGAHFHSAYWRGDVDLEGRDVAVIGTGASAMQFLRSVADKARHVTIFQRSPQWARPPQDYHGKVTEEQQWLLKHVPYYYGWYRFGLMWRFGDGLLPTLYKDPSWPYPERSMNARNDKHREQLAQYIVDKLGDRPDLLEKAMPNYPPYGKRILIDNGWFDALKRPNVSLITQAVDHVEGREIVTAQGERHQADVILVATGFEVGRMLGPLEITGRGGMRLQDVWADDDPKAYLGMTVPDFPNLFVLVGPGTGLAHGGSIFMVAECQIRYVTRMLCTMIERNWAAVDVRREVYEDYLKRFDAEHEKLVWAHPGMTNWYRNAKGRVFVPMPWRLVDYWWMTREPRLEEFMATATPPSMSAAGATP